MSNKQNCDCCARIWAIGEKVKATTAFYIVMLFCVTACTTTLDPKASTVRVLDDADGHNCSFISVLTSFDVLGANQEKEIDNAMNELRNKAAQIDANAVEILDIESYRQGANITANALRCEFAE